MAEPPSLREIPLFASLDEATLQRLVHDAKTECFQNGDVIFRQGDRTTWIVFVLRGFVKLLRVAAGGDETVIDICCDGQSVNEALTLGGEFYHVSAESVGPTRVVKVSAARFTQLLRECPSLATAVIHEATNKICRLVAEIESLKAQSADERLARFILALCSRGEEKCQFRLPYDKRLIAARLGVQQETLSRAFAKLRDYGVRTETRLVFVDSVTRLAAAYNDLESHKRMPSEIRVPPNDARDAAVQ